MKINYLHLFFFQNIISRLKMTTIRAAQLGIYE